MSDVRPGRTIKREAADRGPSQSSPQASYWTLAIFLNPALRNGLFATGDNDLKNPKRPELVSGDRNSVITDREKRPSMGPLRLRASTSRFRRTGWWRMQSSETGLCIKNPCFVMEQRTFRTRLADPADENTAWQSGFEQPPHFVRAQITGNLRARIREFEDAKQRSMA